MTNRFISNSKVSVLALHAAFWLLILTINLLLFGWIASVNMMVLRSLGNTALLAVLFYFNSHFLVNRFFESKKYLSYLAFALAAILILIPVRVWFNQFFPIVANDDYDKQQKAYIIAALLTNTGIVLLSALYQVTVNRLEQERLTLAAMGQQKETELQFLKAQINPHFLFNTLNNIYSLAMVRSSKTADMVLKLSNLLRYVIYESQQEVVMLDKEIAHIQQFIELFKMRSEEPLDIRFRTEGMVNGVQIEPMVLIPLVENCFKHCDFDTNPDTVFVDILIKVEKNYLQFTSINTKNDGDRQKDLAGGVGLENIRRRLDLKYPNGYELSTLDLGSTFEVKLKLLH